MWTITCILACALLAPAHSSIMERIKPGAQTNDELFNNTETVMSTIFTSIWDTMNTMDNSHNSLMSSLVPTYLEIPTDGISNQDVRKAYELFKTNYGNLLADFTKHCNGMKAYIEAIRMAMHTCQETLNQILFKLRTRPNCPMKQQYNVINQMRTCTFRALTTCKSEVAIMQDGVSDASMELHMINMRTSHCVLMNPKNSVPCLGVLNEESPEIISSAKADLPIFQETSRVIDSLNRCPMKILENEETWCQ